MNDSSLTEKPTRGSRAGTVKATNLSTLMNTLSPTALSNKSMNSDEPFASPTSLLRNNSNVTPQQQYNNNEYKSNSSNSGSSPGRKIDNNYDSMYDYSPSRKSSSSSSPSLAPVSTSVLGGPLTQQAMEDKNHYDYNYYVNMDTVQRTLPSTNPILPSLDSVPSNSKYHSDSKNSPSLSTSSGPTSSSPLMLTLDTMDKYHARIKELEAKIKKLQDDSGQKIAKLSLALQQALVQNQTTKEQYDNKVEEVAQLQHESNSLREDMEQLLEEINNLREEKALNDDMIQQLTKERDHALDQLAHLEHNIKSAMENVQTVSDTVDKLKKAEDQIQSLKDALQESEQRVEIAEANLREAQAQADQAEANVLVIQSETDQLRQQTAQLPETLEKMKEHYEQEIQNLRNSFHQQLEKMHAEHKDIILSTEINAQAKVDRTLTDAEATTARVSVEAAEKIATLQLQLEQQKYDYEQEIQALRENHNNEIEIERERYTVLLQKERDQHLETTLQFDKKMTQATEDFVHQLQETRLVLEKDIASVRATAEAEKEVLQMQMQAQINNKNKEIIELQELISDPEKSPIYKYLRQKIYSAGSYLDTLRADLKSLKRDLVLQVRDLHLYSGNIVNDCMRVTVQAIDQVYDLNDTAFGWAEEAARLQQDLSIEQDNNVSLRTLLSSERLEAVHTTSRIVGYATHLRKEMEELRSDLRILRETTTDTLRQTQIEIYNGLAEAVQLMAISAAKSGANNIVVATKSTENKYGLVSSPSSNVASNGSSSAPSSNFASPEAVQVHLKAAEAAVADAKADAERAYQRAKLNLTASDAYVATLQAERESLAKEVILLRTELNRVGPQSSNIRKKHSQSAKYFAQGSTVNNNDNYNNRPTVLVTPQMNNITDDEDDDDEPVESYSEQLARVTANGSRTVPAYPGSKNISHDNKNVFAAFQEVLQQNSTMVSNRNIDNVNGNINTNSSSSASPSTSIPSNSPAYFREAMNIVDGQSDTNGTGNSKIRIKKTTLK